MERLSRESRIIMAAGKWGISDRRVLQYCNAGQIEGTVKMGNTWLIPRNAEKPSDGRFKNTKNKETESKENACDE